MHFLVGISAETSGKIPPALPPSLPFSSLGLLEIWMHEELGHLWGEAFYYQVCALKAAVGTVLCATSGGL